MKNKSVLSQQEQQYLRSYRLKKTAEYNIERKQVSEMKKSRIAFVVSIVLILIIALCNCFLRMT